MKRSAFTLVELLVVISIIGLLSTVAVVSMASSRDKARYTRIIADMKQIGKAVDLYYSTVGAYPADVSPGTLPAGMATYLAAWPKTPCSAWSYDYQNWSSGNVIEVTVYNGSVHRFYLCLDTTTGYSCSGTDDITAYASKSITCNE